MNLASWVLLVLLAAYAMLSFYTWVRFAQDKAAARAGRRRVPEKNLLSLCAAGGWAGGILASYLLRHKTRKLGFQLVLWGAAVLHLSVLYAVFHGATWRAVVRMMLG